MAEISVIVPVYKVEGQLLRCLESLRAQTFSDIEVICVDDGSPDRCGEMLDRFAAGDGRFKVLHRKNGGLSAARNSGMELATAPYLMFCDSDDYVEPNWCATLYGAIAGSGADLAVGGVVCEGLSARNLAVQQDYFRHPCEGACAIDERVLLETDACAWDKIYRRETVVSRGIRFADGLRHEDEFFFWDYALWSGRIAYVPEKTYHYVLRDDGIMGGERTDSAAVFDYVRGFRAVVERAKREPSAGRFRLALLRRLLELGRYALELVPAGERPSLLDGFAGLVGSLAVGVDAQRLLSGLEQKTLCRMLKRDMSIEFAQVRRMHGLLKRKETPFRETLYLAGIPVRCRRGRFADFMEEWRRRKS